MKYSTTFALAAACLAAGGMLVAGLRRRRRRARRAERGGARAPAEPAMPRPASGGGSGGTDGGSDAGSGPDYSSCSADGWCWAAAGSAGQRPCSRPGPNSRTDVWVAGLHGTVLHHDGKSWSNAVVPTTVRCAACGRAGRATSGLWVTTAWCCVSTARPGRSRRFRSARTAARLTTDLTAITGSAPNDVWITGAGGTLVSLGRRELLDPNQRHHAKAQRDLGRERHRGLGGGGRRTVLYYDGVEWAAQTSGTGAALYSVHGTGPNDVWAAGAAILHYDGTRWTDARAGTQTTTLWEVVAEARTRSGYSETAAECGIAKRTPGRSVLRAPKARCKVWRGSRPASCSAWGSSARWSTGTAPAAPCSPAAPRRIGWRSAAARRTTSGP